MSYFYLDLSFKLHFDWWMGEAVIISILEHMEILVLIENHRQMPIASFYLEKVNRLVSLETQVNVELVKIFAIYLASSRCP